jgi:HTH-type transcriptional regulator / antitoxin HigA
MEQTELIIQSSNFQPFVKFNAAIGGITPATNKLEYKHLISLMQDLTDQYHPDDPRVMALFDILAAYISDFENKNLEFPVGKPEDVLRHLMQEHNVSQTDLEREGIASQSQLSNILAGRREISKSLAKRLAARFNVALEMLL